MESKESIKETIVVLISAVILSLSFSFKETKILLFTFLCFVIIVGVNVLAKKVAGFFLEINVKTNFWSWYRYGFRKGSHFKKPIPMLWLPLFLTLVSNGVIKWLAILEFDVEAKKERVSRRHGQYRFTEVTEWHIAWIALWGIITNIFLAIISYLLGQELLSKLSIYYAAWCLIPISSLDGSKIFFANRVLWSIFATIVGILTIIAIITI